MGSTSARSAERRRQLPWIALGVLLVVMSMLGFALWSLQQSERTPVLVASGDIEAGDIIDDDDLIPVAVGADSGLNVLEVGQEEQVVGRAARGPIPAGTPLSATLVVGRAEVVPDGRAVVGAALEPGEHPASSLRAGDEVILIRTGDSGSAVSADAASADAASELERATVWAVEPLAVTSGGQELFVSLLVSTEGAAETAAVAAQGRLRLVLVGTDS